MCPHFDSLKLTSKSKSSLKWMPAAAPLVTGEGRLTLAEERWIKLNKLHHMDNPTRLKFTVSTRDQTILQNLIFFYCHEILCMIYHIRAKTYGFFSVGCSQSCILGPKVG